MNTNPRNREILFASLAALLSAGVAMGQEDPPPTTRARRNVTVHVNFDPDVIALTPYMLNEILQRDELAQDFLEAIEGGEATSNIKQVRASFSVRPIEITGGQTGATPQFDAFAQSPGHVEGSLIVQVIHEQQRDATPEQWRTIQTLAIKGLTAELEAMADEALVVTQGKTDQEKEALDLQLYQLERDLNGLNRAIATQSPGDATRVSYDRALAARQEASLKLAGLEARREAIEAEIALLKEAAAANDLNAQVVEQMRQIVEFRAENVATLEAARSATPQSVAPVQIGAARVELAEAKVDLLRAEKAAAAAGASPQIAALANDFSRTTIEMAEHRAILAGSESELGELREKLEEELESRIRAEQLGRELAVMQRVAEEVQSKIWKMDMAENAPERTAKDVISVIPWSE